MSLPRAHYLGSRLNRDPDIGLGERRCCVDAGLHITIRLSWRCSLQMERSVPSRRKPASMISTEATPNVAGAGIISRASQLPSALAADVWLGRSCRGLHTGTVYGFFSMVHETIEKRHGIFKDRQHEEAKRPTADDERERDGQPLSVTASPIRAFLTRGARRRDGRR